ncbi:unnamed protein product [Orchesella dallaii]|uniref:Uncharacterized protein n=1 Tax=Orchesella dallaii TaxID=48710 RepID=A0ABP1QF91_9HEXA
MRNLPFSVLVLLVQIFTFFHLSHSYSNRTKLDISSLNKKVVGISLRANGKRYYISSELCPGGVFLTRTVNENCLCYNGIFHIVRDCCSVSNTRIHTDALEWRTGYKCGTISGSENVGRKPIRAILPITKPHNRFGSVIVERYMEGNKTHKWNKFDMQDVIIKNHGRISLHGKSDIEIINIQPLGRPVKMRMGKKSETTICYRGWVSSTPFQNLRINITQPGETPKGCCVRITEENSPGTIVSECTPAIVVTSIVTIKSANSDEGTCSDDTPDESPHTLKKRNPTRIVRNSLGEPIADDDYDVLGDTGSIMGRKELELDYDPDLAPFPELVPNPNLINFEEDAITGKSKKIKPLNVDEGPANVIMPRTLGISNKPRQEQAKDINEFIAIIRHGIEKPREPETHRFQLLKKSIDIFLKVVPNDAVPHSMIQTAFDIFYYLFEELDPMIHEAPAMQLKALTFLENCKHNEPVLNFTTQGCPREIKQLVVDPGVMKKLETYYEGQPDELKDVLNALEHVEIRKDRRFVVELYDIYVEINWKVADFVHSFCFEHFGTEFNAHHYFESELETLFLFPEVQQRWFSKAKDLSYARGILGTSNLKTRMRQLDKVAAVGHYLSRYNGTFWLHRPNRDPMLMYAEDSKANSKLGGGREESRLAFTKHLLEEDDQFSQETLQSRRSSAEVARHMSYPFHFPEKLPPGELIWDGLAVCLHARYSNRRSYFRDSNTWGITPTLQELGDLFPLAG